MQRWASRRFFSQVKSQSSLKNLKSSQVTYEKCQVKVKSSQVKSRLKNLKSKSKFESSQVILVLIKIESNSNQLHLIIICSHQFTFIYEKTKTQDSFYRKENKNFQHGFIMSEKQLREICNETFVVGFILQERAQFVL